MSQKVAAVAAPWIDIWNGLISNGHASLGRTPQPQTVVCRGSDDIHSQNYTLLFNDVAATYACALRWKISGSLAYADKAVQILNAWLPTLTAIGGDTNAALAAGIYGYEFANAAEITRTYSDWVSADFARFKTMTLNVLSDSLTFPFID